MRIWRRKREMARISATSRHIKPAASTSALYPSSSATPRITTRNSASSRSVDRPAPSGRRRRVPAACRGTRRRARVAFGVILIGTLVDDAEAHVFQHWHPLGQRDRAVRLHTFRPIPSARLWKSTLSGRSDESPSMMRMSAAATAGDSFPGSRPRRRCGSARKLSRLDRIEALRRAPLPARRSRCG